MAPANNRKFNMAPIRISVRSTLKKSRVIRSNVCGKILSVAKSPKETSNAITMIPMEAGNFKKRALMYEKMAEMTIKAENE